MKKTKVLFVCLGNICRSPLADAIFHDVVQKNGMEDKFEIESCGIGAWHVGELPDARMVAEANKHGIEMTHKARTLSPEDFEYYDLILPMDLSNLTTLLSKSPEEFKHKIKLFRTFDILGGEDAEVPDPYYGEDEGFKNVYEIVERTCNNIIKAL